MRKPVYAMQTNKDAGQPAQPHSLIRTFVVRGMNCMIPIIAYPKILKSLASFCS